MTQIDILRNCTELCNFGGKFDVLCSLNPIYASTSLLITHFTKNIQENGILERRYMKYQSMYKMNLIPS